MATDPNGGSPFATKQRLTSAAANILRANDLIQLDTDGGSRAMSAKLTLTGTGVLEVSDKYLVTSRSETREAPMLLGAYDSGNASFTGVNGGRFNTTTTTSSDIFVPITKGLMNGQVLDTVAVWFKAAATGDANHHSGALGVVPKLRVFRTLQSTGTDTQLGSTTNDAVNTRAAYETRRLISVASIAHTIDTEKNTYWIQFTFEGGANAYSGAHADAIEITSTVTYHPAGGS
mgnify:CR=1 FL=1